MGRGGRVGWPNMYQGSKFVAESMYCIYFYMYVCKSSCSFRKMSLCENIVESKKKGLGWQRMHIARAGRAGASYIQTKQPLIGPAPERRGAGQNAWEIITGNGWDRGTVGGRGERGGFRRRGGRTKSNGGILNVHMYLYMGPTLFGGALSMLLTTN